MSTRKSKANDNLEIKTSEEVKKTVKKVKTEDNFLIGTVFNCGNLRVRSEPTVFSETLQTIESGKSVKVYKDSEIDGFYKVKVGNKTGYCMKIYINLEEK